ncbi:choice-of-anchor M domain-containing protein [Corynebacterium cystitidis]|uniref:choice-of-anchor M domain-containing protein n=1 Tax=Corynebacterium cystitidis TaxID=35757 RepID=UPI00211E0A7A|nr:choice-of-anchor M domain-containing protein [Corynebacterium cystitidis]
MKTRCVATACVTALLAVATPQLPMVCAQADPALEQTVTADEQLAPEGEQAVISAGHVDVGPQVVDGDLKFLARDDTSVPPVWRSIDDIVFEVGDASIQTLPDNVGSEFEFTGAGAGDSLWVIPQTEVPSVPWLGWNTQAPSLLDLDIDRGVTLEFAGHQGPGQFSLFIQNGGFEPPQVLWNSAAEGTQPLFVDLNTHTHANWVFTEPGVHLVGLRVVAPLKDGTELVDERILRFAVGGAQPTDAFVATWDESEEIAADPSDGETAGDQSDDNGVPVVWIGVGLAILGVLAAVGAGVMRSQSTKRKAAAAAVRKES